MKTLQEWITDAERGGYAIGHFNFATAEMLRGIVEAAKETGKPVIVGVSEGERDFIGIDQVRALVTVFRKEFDIPIFLNADHTKSYERAQKAIDADFDAIVVDGSALSFSENVEMVKKVITYSKQTDKNITVEGELGFIGTSSEVLEKLPPGVAIDEAHMTGLAEAEKFVKETGVDLLAPSVGNVHGIIREGGNPSLSIKRIKEIRKAVSVPLVLHGASGIAEDDIKNAVKAGATVVHFSTDIRLAFRKGISAALADNPEEISPYKYMREAIKAVKEAVKGKIELIS